MLAKLTKTGGASLDSTKNLNKKKGLLASGGEDRVLGGVRLPWLSWLIPVCPHAHNMCCAESCLLPTE